MEMVLIIVVQLLVPYNLMLTMKNRNQTTTLRHAMKCLISFLNIMKVIRNRNCLKNYHSQEAPNEETESYVTALKP